MLKLQGYNAACDIWSAGVLLYTMLAGHTPYAHGPRDDSQAILERIEAGSFSLSGGNWDSVSAAAKDLVRRMLHVDPAKRLTAQQTLQHPWVAQRENLPQFRLAVRQDASQMKSAMRATFAAMNSAPIAQLQQVGASELARRRGRPDGRGPQHALRARRDRHV